ncbi:hypothetical protein [Pseudomonas sp. S1Bt23]|nr:hypothetical protein [Pseudomonas sp. S1Bt23]WPO45834.1 hypothetical protein SHB59_21455 [Pseudomonas sp. S1Bt23]
MNNEVTHRKQRLVSPLANQPPIKYLYIPHPLFAIDIGDFQLTTL